MKVRIPLPSRAKAPDDAPAPYRVDLRIGWTREPCAEGATDSQSPDRRWRLGAYPFPRVASSPLEALTVAREVLAKEDQALFEWGTSIAGSMATIRVELPLWGWSNDAMVLTQAVFLRGTRTIDAVRRVVASPRGTVLASAGVLDAPNVPQEALFALVDEVHILDYPSFESFRPATSEDMTALSDVAFAAEVRGDVEEAVRIGRVLVFLSDAPVFSYFLGTNLAQAGQIDEASRLLDRVIASGGALADRARQVRGLLSGKLLARESKAERTTWKPPTRA